MKKLICAFLILSLCLAGCAQDHSPTISSSKTLTIPSTPSVATTIPPTTKPAESAVPLTFHEMMQIRANQGIIDYIIQPTLEENIAIWENSNIPYALVQGKCVKAEYYISYDPGRSGGHSCYYIELETIEFATEDFPYSVGDTIWGSDLTFICPDGREAERNFLVEHGAVPNEKADNSWKRLVITG